MNFGPSYSKAVSLRTSRVAYYRQFGNSRSDYEVIDVETGEVSTLSPTHFKALYVPDGQLPPHMRHITESAPPWWDWKAARGRM